MHRRVAVVAVVVGGGDRVTPGHVWLVASGPAPTRATMAERGNVCFWTETQFGIAEGETLDEPFSAWRALVEQAPDFVTVVDRDHTIVFINRVVPGLELENVVGGSVYQFISSEYLEQLRDHIDAAFAGSKPSMLVTTAAGPDGTTAWYENRIGPIRSDGDVAHVSVIGTDITGRMEAEERLRVSEARFRRLAELSPVGIYITDEEGNCLYTNARWQAMAGLTAEQAAGRGWVDGLHPEDRARISEDWYEAVRSRRRWYHEYRFQNRDGEITWVLGTAARLEREGRQEERYIGVNVDISAIKQAEQERGSLQRQLHEAQKMEAIAALAGGIAHDFNNALTGILTNSSVALMDLEPDEPLSEIFEEIVESANHAAELTRKLVAFGRRQVFEKRVVEIGEVLEEVETLLDRVLGEHIEITWRNGDDVGPVCVDPGEIEQVILNVAVNARDAMPHGGRLVFETGEILFAGEGHGAPPEMSPGRYVTLVIRDDGTGMAPEVLDRVFEPFFTTKEFGLGTGMGMATAFGVVRQHDGWIAAESEPGKGTTFTVYLPRAGGDTDRCSRPSSETGAGIGTQTILVVEDEPRVRKVMRRALQRLGYTVYVAEDGRDALAQVVDLGESVDLLLTDVIMPGLNGPMLARELTARYPDLRVLFMSGYSGDLIAPHGVLEDDVTLLRKPISMQVLADKVREALES